MSQSTPSPGSPSRPSVQNRRLSIIQDAAVDDLHDIDTHALDKKPPPAHHESSVMSYMESHFPNDESSHNCSPRSPLMGRGNPVVDGGKVETRLEVRRVEENAPCGKETDLVRTPPEPSANISYSEPKVKDASTLKSAVDV